MTTNILRSALAALAFIAFTSSSVIAEGEQKSAKHSTGMKAMGPKPKLDSAAVMKITQTAMVHIAAAEQALEQRNKKAAKSALQKSERELARLYNEPALGPLMTELDNAIDSVSGKTADIDELDLAPLTASVETYQAYIDPDVAANVDKARERAQSGDAEGAEDALRLARNRVEINTAFVPVEDAYVRVLAAQRALERGNMKQASRLLDNVPIIVSRVQVSQPLLPIRFKLHAAAEAAEQESWDRTEQLLSEVDRDLEQLEGMSSDKHVTQELSSIGTEVERIRQNAIAGKNPQPSQIRQLAQRVKSFGRDTEMSEEPERELQDPEVTPQPQPQQQTRPESGTSDMQEDGT